MTYAYDSHVQSSTIEHSFILAPYDANYCRSGQTYADPTPCLIVRREGYPTLLGRAPHKDIVESTIPEITLRDQLRYAHEYSHVFIVSESDLERARITGAIGNK